MDSSGAKPPPDWMLESLAHSEAQIDAGHTVALDAVLGRARASLGRMEKSERPKPELQAARKA
jgi:hypothetical protein